MRPICCELFDKCVVVPCESDFLWVEARMPIFFPRRKNWTSVRSPLFTNFSSTCFSNFSLYWALFIDHEINWNQRTKIMLHVFVQWHCDLFEVNSLMYIVYSACTGQNLMANSRKTLWSQQQEHWSLAPILTIAFISLFINHSRMFFAVVFQSSIHKKGISLVLAILTWTVIPFVIILCVYT